MQRWSQVALGLHMLLIVGLGFWLAPNPQALVTDMFHLSEGGESCPRSPLRAPACKSLNLAEVSIQGGEVGVLCEHHLSQTYKKHL